MRILITGGAGFVGSSLARLIKRDRLDAEVVAFDNLARRGSELSIERLRACGADFVHGDIRCFEDLEALGRFDWILDCSAEPSVQAGYEGGARALLRTNLDGTIHCLELARLHRAAISCRYNVSWSDP
jgi:CDP-paratose 2-epimerase